MFERTFQLEIRRTAMHLYENVPPGLYECSAFKQTSLQLPAVIASLW